MDIDKLAIENRFAEDLIRYRGFMQSVLKQNGEAATTTNVDICYYAKYILMTGKREDKQVILVCVTTTLYLKSKTIQLRKFKFAKF